MVHRRVAVVGTGSIGIRHLKILQSLGVEAWAIPKRKKRLADLKEQRFCVAVSLKEASEQGVSAAIIASDTGQHADDAKQALEWGMDLLIEKPLSIDQQSALSVFQMAQKLDKNVFVACVLRFSESLNLFRFLLNRIGSLHSVQIECRSYLPDWRPGRDYLQSYSAKKEEGGVLRDLIHEIDYATWTFGWPGSVWANLSNLGRLGIEAEEIAQLSWQVPSGTNVSLHLGYLSKIPVRTMKALGEKGILEWDGIADQVLLNLSGKTKEIFNSKQKKDDIYVEQSKAFLFSPKSSLATAVEGSRALALCDAARRSSELRKEEKVDYLV